MNNKEENVYVREEIGDEIKVVNQEEGCPVNEDGKAILIKADVYNEAVKKRMFQR